MKHYVTCTGHTVSGNTIAIEAEKEAYDTFCGTNAYHWGEINVTINGHKINIEDLSERNIEWIMEQFPCL